MRNDLIYSLSDRRPERVCFDLAEKTLTDLALKSPAERAEGIRVLLVVLREHAGCPAQLIAELNDLLEELGPGVPAPLPPLEGGHHDEGENVADEPEAPAPRG